MTRQKGRPVRIPNWMKTIGAFLVLQLIFVILDTMSWVPNFKESGMLDRLYNWKFFTEWFTPYKTTEFNVLTIFLGMLLFLDSLTSIIQNIFSRKRNQSAHKLQ
ncbi:hypothetical protein BAMA_06820 [Bacillus manliponensis]|uniref:YfzA-like protein n=1 Tax=Bacillus manliponensis TaxID=574376 RepID=A0A073JVD4_9BACI|nr:YfzA family protein [Bacillus manliponensis]KEK18265.1 hypothetical protein BAMA_06820 [Bacillus manliponensis]